MPAFSSSLQKLFEQGSLRAIQAIQAPGLESDMTSTQAKVELLTMWREIFQTAPTQLGAQALHDVTLTTCGLLWGQPSNLATAAASPSLSSAIFTLLALALQINENARFLVEQSVLPCSKAVWVALSYKVGFADHLAGVGSDGHFCHTEGSRYGPHLSKEEVDSGGPPPAKKTRNFIDLT